MGETFWLSKKCLRQVGDFFILRDGGVHTGRLSKAGGGEGIQLQKIELYTCSFFFSIQQDYKVL